MSDRLTTYAEDLGCAPLRADATDGLAGSINSSFQGRLVHAKLIPYPGSACKPNLHATDVSVVQ